MIDYVALYKSLMLVGTILLLFFIFTYAPLHNNTQYESCEGTIVDKYKILTEKSIFNNRAYYDYYIVVDCNGTNRTMHYYYTQLGTWSTKNIGDKQIVTWEVGK